jgi:hypothetical protein
MLAADKLLLRSHVKQNLISLREKELNLFNSNFSAVATQAALLAGFSMAFLEMSVHLQNPEFHPIPRGLLHVFSTISISANVFVVSLITFVSVWGSGKALRGRDGSMGKVVEGMNTERWLIFRCFGVGLLSLLLGVACSTWLLMNPIVAGGCTAIILFTAWQLVSNAMVRPAPETLAAANPPPPPPPRPQPRPRPRLTPLTKCRHRSPITPRSGSSPSSSSSRRAKPT